MNELIDQVVDTVWIAGLSPSQDGIIPEELYAPLFDGPQRTYAVFDTRSVKEGLALVESEPGYYGSLLMGDLAEDLADVMPCLLELSPDGDLTRKLFREVPGGHPSMGALHLWPSNPVLFVRCNATPEQLRRHLHRFIKPLDFSGSRRYVRLWNPSIIFDYLFDLEAPTTFLKLYLDGPQDPLTIIARKDDRVVIACAKAPAEAAERLVLSKVDIKALTFRTKMEFHENLVSRVLARGDAKGHRFQRKRVSHIALQVMTAMENHKRDDVPKMKDHEQLTLVLLIMHEDATDLILSGPVIRNDNLPWAKRVDIVAKSYLTGLRRMHGQEVV